MTKKVSKKAAITKKPAKKTLSKDPTSVKWPIKKFLNKFTIYNLFVILGVAMLILSAVCKNAFKDADGNLDNMKVTWNYVASAIVLAAGIAGEITYGLLLHFKGEKPLDKKFAHLCTCWSWVPILGLVFGIMWKHREKAALYVAKIKENPNFRKPKLQLPNSVSIIFAAMVGVVFVIWVLYLSGVLKPNGATVIPGVLDIFLNPLRGFGGYDHKVIETVGGIQQVTTKHVNGVGSLVIFLLVFNGCMTLVNDAHAIEAGIGALLKKMKGKEIILIPVLMFILAICGSTFNMCEQLLPLFLVVIPIFFAAGYDRMTGFLVVFMSAGVGIIGSTVNPVLIGTGISAMDGTIAGGHISIMTGVVWRLVLFVVVTATAITCTMLYARKVKKNPRKSCVYMQEADFAKHYNFDKDALPPMTKKRKWTLIVFALAFLMLIVGFIDWETIIPGCTIFSQGTRWLSNYFPFLSSIGSIGKWGMIEAGMLFLIASFIIGAINWKSAGHWFATFYAGCREFIGVAFIVAVAKGLAITLTDSGVNDIIAKGLGGALKNMGAVGIILMVFLVISLLTIFIPSSSGLASAMFPVIGPAIYTANPALLSGSVTAFAAAMGWVNLFTPTGMLLPFLEVSKMDMGDFVKSAWKHILIVLVVTVGMLAVGTCLPLGNMF